jgi:putative nucleotidyltransferase with HDIG domain
MRQRILFVDDDPQVLSGLRRMLWDMRSRWEMHFAGSGAEGLALLAELPMDVVITDARMPGMDGPTFLEEVRRQWPGTARMILSGHSDREYVMRSVKPAHQFLSKPCSPEELKATISRLLGLGEFFRDERLRQAITRIDTLPVLPSVFAELTDELRSPNASVKTMGEIISRDIGLATGILKLVNSSYFGLPRRVSSTEQAVTLLGTETLRAVVLSHYLFSRFDTRRYPRFGLDNLWSHSLGVARFARTMAALEGADKTDKDVCFMAGLVHDMGKLVLAELFRDDYLRVLTMTREKNLPIRESEMAVLGVSHAEVGGYLLGLWGFEEAVVVAVCRHHEPGRAGPDAPLSVALLHAANALEHEIVIINRHYAPHPLLPEALASRGLEDRYPVWREACQNVLQGERGE